MIIGGKKYAHAYLLKVNDVAESINDFIGNLQSESSFKEPLPTSDPIKINMEEYRLSWYKKFSKKEIEDIYEDGSDNKRIYYQATAKIESPRRDKVDKDGNLLDREKRININYPDVLLFAKNKKIFVVVITSYTPDVNRVSMLLGKEKVAPIQEDDFIENNFFEWIFYLFSNKKDIIKNLNLNNIDGFTGTILDSTNTFKGDSEQTASLTITKAFVSDKWPFDSLKLDLMDSFAQETLVIKTNQEITILIKKSSLFMNIQNPIEDLKTIFAYLYIILFPKIITKYKKERNKFIQKNNIDFSKKIGIEVISSIMKKNKITIDEIREYPKKSSRLKIKH
ncbi:MAG: hypothetical protein ABF750_08160 [Oenococcus oeni]